MRSRRYSILRRTVSPVLCAVVVVALLQMPASGQAFTELKSSLVDYSKSDIEPRKMCEAMARLRRRTSLRSAP